MLGDGISRAGMMASPPKLDKSDCLSRGADDFANDSAAHGIDAAGELGVQRDAGRLCDPPAVLGSISSVMWTVSVASVPSSSCPISRVKPTASVAKIAAGRAVRP